MSFLRRRRRRLRDLPSMLCWAPPLGRRTRPEPVSLNRFAAARLVFILGTGVPPLTLPNRLPARPAIHRALEKRGARLCWTPAGVSSEAAGSGDII